MPHLVVRHSSNLGKMVFKDYLLKSHHYLVKKLNTKISSCKSLVLKSDEYLISDGEADLAFIHIEVMLKSGRDLSLLQEVGNYLV